MNFSHLWRHTKIVTLSRILLTMMALAGIFFTGAFGFLHHNLSELHTHWQGLQAGVSTLALPTETHAVLSSISIELDTILRNL